MHHLYKCAIVLIIYLNISICKLQHYNISIKNTKKCLNLTHPLHSHTFILPLSLSPLYHHIIQELHQLGRTLHQRELDLGDREQQIQQLQVVCSYLFAYGFICL